MLIRLAAILTILGSAIATLSYAQLSQSDIVEYEVPLGSAFYLKSIGGPDKNLVILSETSSEVRYSISDPNLTRTVIRYDRFGYPYTEQIPVASTQIVKKSNGLSVSGSLGKLYPLYADRLLTIYFYDRIASQNFRRIAVKFNDNNEGQKKQKGSQVIIAR